MIFLVGFLLILSSASGKIYERCELAKELKYAYGAPESEVATWVCIARHESEYNTAAVGRPNYDNSTDHGLFQINDRYWCSPPGKGKACGLPCSKFEDDDISDDFKCVKKIHKEHQHISGDGFNAWTVYKLYCDGSKSHKYIEGCFKATDLDVTQHPKKTTTTKKVYPWLLPRHSSTSTTKTFTGLTIIDNTITTDDSGNVTPLSTTNEGPTEGSQTTCHAPSSPLLSKSLLNALDILSSRNIFHTFRTTTAKELAFPAPTVTEPLTQKTSEDHKRGVRFIVNGRPWV